MDLGALMGETNLLGKTLYRQSLTTKGSMGIYRSTYDRGNHMYILEFRVINFTIIYYYCLQSNFLIDYGLR